MADWTPYLIAVAAVALWTAFFIYLQQRKLLEPRNVTLAGPIVMWKTGRGRALIDRLARPKRFWRAFGDLSIVLVGVTMVAVTLLLVWEASLVQSAAVRANPPSPDLLLGLPGINPVIPLGYGVFGLAVAIVLHEFCHGILARAVNIKVRSVGAIFLVVPIGAFVEPDEDELRGGAPRPPRPPGCTRQAPPRTSSSRSSSGSCSPRSCCPRSPRPTRVSASSASHLSPARRAPASSRTRSSRG